MNTRKWRGSAQEALCNRCECGEYYVIFKVTLHLFFFVALGTEMLVKRNTAGIRVPDLLMPGKEITSLGIE